MNLSIGGNFSRLWVAVAAANLSDGIRVAALPLLAAELTRSPPLIAGISAASTLPWLVFALFAGALVDRVNHRRLMASSNLVRAAAVLLVAILLFLAQPSLWLLYLVALVAGTMETLVDNAAQALVPALVPATDLETANGRIVTSEVAGNEAVGPSVGGLLFSAHPALPFLVKSILLTGAAASIFSLRLEAPRRGVTGRTTLLREVREGLRVTWGDERLRYLALAGGTLVISDSAWYAVLVLYGIEVLNADEIMFGVLLACGGIGGVLAGLLSSGIWKRLGSRRSLILAMTVTAMMQSWLAINSTIWGAALALAVSSGAFTVFNVAAVTLRQRVAPAQLLGRIHSTYRFVAIGAAPVGAAAGGLVAQWLGLRAAFLIGIPLVILAAWKIFISSAEFP